MKLRQVAFAIVVVALATPAWSQAAAKKWQGYLEFLGKPGTERSLGQSDLLLPVYQDMDSLLFLNLRGQLDDGDSEEYNVGLGYRRLHDKWILGGVGFLRLTFDRERSHFSSGQFWRRGPVGRLGFPH